MLMLFHAAGSRQMPVERRPPSRASPFMAPSPLSPHASPAMARLSSQSPASPMLRSAVMSPTGMSPAVNVEPSVMCECPIYVF